MNRNEYLNSTSVKEFIDWIECKMDTSNSFLHAYTMKKPVMEWKCDSINSAFENYWWAFRFKDPISGNIIRGNTFYESYEALQRLSNGLRKSIKDSDADICMRYCFSILEWGGVLTHNDKRIINIGNNLCRYLENVRNTFQCDLDISDYYNDKIIMNSGFTKIYSLCIDDFIIYDGRVGAALGLLVRLFCEESEQEKVPIELAFAWGKGKESTYKGGTANRRNPCSEVYAFPELMNNPERHTENNIKANWLLREIIDNTNSKFRKLDKNTQMRALESALFMIGYDVTRESTC